MSAAADECEAIAIRFIKTVLKSDLIEIRPSQPKEAHPGGLSRTKPAHRRRSGLQGLARTPLSQRSASVSACESSAGKGRRVMNSVLETRRARGSARSKRFFGHWHEETLRPAPDAELWHLANAVEELSDPEPVLFDPIEATRVLLAYQFASILRRYPRVHLELSRGVTRTSNPCRQSNSTDRPFIQTCARR